MGALSSFGMLWYAQLVAQPSGMGGAGRNVPSARVSVWLAGGRLVLIFEATEASVHNSQANDSYCRFFSLSC